MKRLLLCIVILGFGFCNAQNPFVNSSYDYSSTVCNGDGQGNCDPNNSDINLTGTVNVTLTGNPNEFEISDITGGQYEQVYGVDPNPAVVSVDVANQSLTVTGAPDTVFGGDNTFDATGSYTLNANNEVDTFTLTWSNIFGDGGTNDYTFNSFVSCVTPTNFSVDDKTLSTIDLSWNDTNGANTTFEVEYGSPGFLLGDGTNIGNISSNTTTLNNLSESTSYYIYLRANCSGGDGDSDWVGPLITSTLTDCNTFGTTPITEYFDDVLKFLDCYTVINEDGNNTDWLLEEAELQPDSIVTFATNGASVSQKEDYLISPAINLTSGTTYDVNASYNGADLGDNETANEDLEILMAQGNTVADANAGTSIFSDTGISQNGDFANVENQALDVNVEFTPNTSGDYYLVFKSTGSPAPSQNVTGFLLIFDYSVDETLSTDDFTKVNFDFYKNNGQLLLNANQDLNQISIFSLTGKRILNQKLSSQEETITIQNLANGLYLAKVQIGNQTKTFKFMK